VHGEGVFFQFREQAVENWCREHGQRDSASFAAHVAWRSRRKIESPEAAFPTIRYVLLHTVAHALMRQFALECGYSHAPIRERIYALPPEGDGGPMAGVLLYTAAPDSEGTLGGLVALGEDDASCSGVPRLPLRSGDLLRARQPLPRPGGACAAGKRDVDRLLPNDKWWLVIAS